MNVHVTWKSFHRLQAVAALLVAGLTVVGIGLAHAGSVVNTGYFGSVAIMGYDPVAYFTEGRAVKGSPEFSHDWLGENWYFASAEHRDAFAADPIRYAPQYGGYCSYAVAHGYTADADPRAWKIVGGKLYLNYNEDVRRLWEQDIPGFIQKSETNWPRFLKHKPEHKG